MKHFNAQYKKSQICSKKESIGATDSLYFLNGKSNANEKFFSEK